MAKSKLNEATFEDVYNLATPEEIIDDARNGRMYILVELKTEKMKAISLFLRNLQRQTPLTSWLNLDGV